MRSVRHREGQCVSKDISDTCISNLSVVFIIGRSHFAFII